MDRPFSPFSNEDVALNNTSFPVIQIFSGSRRRLHFFLLLGFLLFAAGSLLFSAATVEAAPRKVAPRVQKKRPAMKRRANVRRGTRNGASQRARTSNVPATLDAPGIGGEEGEGEKIDERQRWFMMQRAYPYDTPPAEGRLKAYLARPKDARRGKDVNNVYAVEQAWRNIGPAPTTPAFPDNWGLTSGRLNSIAIHPTNPQIILIGGATGGIWRSTDGGTNFAPVSDTHVDLAVGSIAFSKSDPSIVYAGMGDLGNGYFGTGVLKSTDAGATWARVSNNTLPPLGTTAKLEVDPTNSNRVYVLQATYTKATSYNDLNPDGTLFRSGFYLSTDGGVNWQQTFRGRPRDLAVHPENPQILYLGMNLADAFGGVPAGPAGLYKSLDGGATWLPAPVFIAPSGTTTTDVRVAVTPANPEKVYLVSGTRTAISFAVSDNGGLTWTTKPMTGVDPGQFGYNSYIYVHPSNADAIYIGTRDVFSSGDGGNTWGNLTKNFVHNPSNANNPYPYNPFNSTSHPDQHAFAFHPSNPDIIYIGNDGGISLSSNGGASFVSLNASLSLTQFVSISMHPTDPNISYGGTQDNGTQRRLAGTNAWKEFSEGDGGRSVINAANPSVVFTTYVYGSVSRFIDNGLGSRTRIADNSTFGEPATGQRIAFYPPMTGNGVDATLYFGTWRLYTCTTCDTSANWTAPGGVSDQTRGGTVNCTITPKPAQCSDVLSAIGVERKAGAQVIYTGSAQGRLMVTQNGGANWTEINLPLGTETVGPLAGQAKLRFIESITVHPSDPATAYVTLGGFGSGHVFRTTNFGQTWTDIGGTPGQPNAIPNVPVSALLIDPLTPTTLYTGTDIGVFRSTDNGATWATFNNGMLPVVVTGFATSNNGAIQLSTYGRGAFELVTAMASTPAIVEFSASNYEFREDAGRATIMVTRSGNTSGAVSVDYRTADTDTFTVGCADKVNNGGGAFARCDFATSIGTVYFAAGEAQSSVTVPIIDDGHAEGSETFQLHLSNVSGATLGSPGIATVTIQDNDAASAQNPVLTTPFFVRQQYLDFLSRAPEAGEPWSDLLNRCPNVFNFDANDPSAGCDRLIVSQSFFGSPEFQLKGFYVFRFYRLAFNRLPDYLEVVADMSFVAGQTAEEVYARKAQLVTLITGRAEFKSQYDGLTNSQYVTALMTRYNLTQVTTPSPQQPDTGVPGTLTSADLTGGLNAGTLTRAQVLRAVADSEAVGASEFNNAFVGMQYYGYLRRKPDADGFKGWLRVLQAGDTRTMVNGFLNSTEYKLRFGQP